MGTAQMLGRFLLLLIVALLTANCGGGDKHLPSSNPPEYDPKKVYTTPAAPPSAPATVAKPTELELLRSQLDSLETASNAKGEGKKVPFDPNLIQLFKGVTNPCEALSRLAPGLGSTQLFAGQEGAALKKALGPDADGIARRMDEQLAEGLKQSLGPGAADCPIAVRPRKSSGLKDQSHPARLVLAHTTPSRPLLLAQTTIPDPSQDDYDVQKSSSREKAPSDWVGYKWTDTMTRIGKKPHTKGIRELYVMIIAPKAKRCPDPAGKVEGTFEWSLEMYRATTGPDGEPHGVLYRRHVRADLKGTVGDDAKVQYVDFDVTVTLQHIGTELDLYSKTYGSQGRFTIDQRMTGLPQDLKITTVSGFSEGEALIKDAQLLGTLTALVAHFSGLTYFDAQKEWREPNTCVQITFMPATKTKKLGPNESVAVKTELRTKEGSTVVPATFKEAKERPMEGNGRVSPREDKSEINRPATFTYQAPAARVKHSGFWVGAVSRAGVAEALAGEWELADPGLRLRIGHRIRHDPKSPSSQAGWVQFDGTVQFEIVLEPIAEGWFRGEIDVVRPLLVHHVTPCSGSGSQTENWSVSARIDPQTELMNMTFSFLSSNEHASWTCGSDIHVNLGGTRLKSVQMPAKDGATKDFATRDIKFLESLSVTVVEGPGKQE